jgi:S-adenosylmethionine uptake transporter
VTDNTRGALLMMASMACFTVNDTFVKMVGGAVPLFQILFLRGVLTTGLLVLLALKLRGLRLRIPRRDAGLVVLRPLSEVGAAWFFLTALFNMPLANVTAILQVLPLTVALGSALVFRERLGWRRLTAILVGFGGMLLIVRPGPEGFSLYAGYALAAVALVTVRDLATRRMSGAVPSLTVTVAAAAGVTLFALPGMVAQGWQPVTPGQAGLLACSALFVMGGYLFSVLVMRVGEVAVTAPFRYTGLIWALVLGWLAFGEWPSALTLVGAAIIAATGIYTMLREARLARAARRAAQAQR